MLTTYGIIKYFLRKITRFMKGSYNHDKKRQSRYFIILLNFISFFYGIYLKTK